PLMILSFIYLEPNKYNELVLDYEESTGHNFNPVKRARSEGFMPAFLHTIKPKYQEHPNEYTKFKANQMKEKYIEIAKKVNETRENSLSDSQTIFYLNETLMDPADVPYLLSNETPINQIHQYMGGGTSNIEWSMLTSFSLEVFNDPISVTPYSDFYSGSKNHQTVLDYFPNNKKAIHPYSAHLYKRKTIYNKIGFDEFLYLN